MRSTRSDQPGAGQTTDGVSPSETGSGTSTSAPMNGSGNGGSRSIRLGSNGSVLEFLGAVNHFQHNIQRYRWYILSISTIRFLSILNVTYSIVGIVFVTLAHFPPENLVFQQLLFYRLGIVLLFFSPMALCADLMALHGLRQYKRVLLLPWLIFYAVMVALAFSVFLTEVFHRGLRWHLLLLGFVAFLMFTRWRHINLQFKLMSIYPDRPTQQAISELAAVVTSSSSSSASSSLPHAATSDLLKNMPPPPPKYEDLEQPPKYEDIADTNPAAEGASPSADGAAAAAALPVRDSVRFENELTDLQAILPALEGQERTDCQTRMEQLQRAKQQFNNDAANGGL